MSYGLGIDTGGTYTDSVIIDFDSGEILSRAKDLTTRNNLVIGISGSIGKHDRGLLEKVSLVSLSSTLATNTVVEGKGCRAGLINIGKQYDGTVHADISAFVNGTHDLHGNEKVPLDLDAAREALESMRGNVDAVAITGYLSIRNPSHEIRVAELAHQILDVPVILGHELSSGLGYNERTSTALMNARLIPVITDLIKSVKESLASFDIKAPLMIVKGDGSIINEDIAVERPVETVLSGPASSITGALKLTGADNAIVVDIGGTTTDIGVLRNGTPRIAQEGAIIGGRRTHVQAAEVSTYGIGGDSRIVVNGTVPSLTPVRVIPLCIAAAKWPHVKSQVELVSKRNPSHAAETTTVAELYQELEFFTPAKPRSTESLSAIDSKLLDLIQEYPRTLDEAGDEIGTLPISFNVAKLERLGLVTRIGVTPSDILHAEGSYVQYDAEASRLAVDFLARKTNKTIGEFIADLKDMITFKIARCIIDDLLIEGGNYESDSRTAEALIGSAITGKGTEDYAVGITLSKPLIGIGAPVKAWLPRVAEIFHTELLLPENSDVGNAIGAISGSVSKSESILIKPVDGAYSVNPPCVVFLKDGKKEFPSFGEAVDFAKKIAGEKASGQAIEGGAANVLLDYTVKRQEFGTAEEGHKVLLEAVVTARATGKPSFSRRL